MNRSRRPRSTRILFLAPDFLGEPGGIARHCRLVCRALGELGYQITVVALHDRPPAAKAVEALSPGYRYVPCSGNRMRFVFESLRCGLWRPDIILSGHVHFGPLASSVSRPLRAKVVALIYGIEVIEALRPWRRRALAGSHVILSCSRFTADLAARVNRLPAQKIRVVHGCLEPGTILSAPARSATEEVSLLTVARITEEDNYKGHDVTLRALAALLLDFPRLRYDIVGDGDGRATLEELARSLGVERAVHFHGAVSEDELSTRYARASVFVMPSRAEGFGYAFLEAMRASLPVIAGNLDASPEVIENGVTGYLVDPRSAPEVTNALQRLLEDPGLRAAMGARGARRATQEFGYPTFKDHIAGYFGEVLELGRPDTVSEPAR